MKLQRKSLPTPNACPLYHQPLRAQEAAKGLLLQRYVPPSVLIDSHCVCVGFFGDAQRYLRTAENSDLFAVAHEHVRGRLKAALNSAWRDDQAPRAAEAAPEHNERVDSMRIMVRPVQVADECFFLVSFLDTQNVCELEYARTSMGNGARRASVPAPLCGGGDKTAASLGLLSPRQRVVLDLMVDGRSNKEIARDLGISRRTVETHRVIVMRKLGARNFADLMRRVAAA